ncbi:hypothetical protein ACTS93_14015 [Empedobacter falsenii]
MKVLIVDDSIHKIDILSEFINNHSPNSYIDTAESISNALKTISNKVDMQTKIGVLVKLHFYN